MSRPITPRDRYEAREGGGGGTGTITRKKREKKMSAEDYLLAGPQFFSVLEYEGIKSSAGCSYSLRASFQAFSGLRPPPLGR